jgi:hypothetical protein
LLTHACPHFARLDRRYVLTANQNCKGARYRKTCSNNPRIGAPDCCIRCEIKAALPERAR